MSENNNSRQLTILTIAAVVMSVASLITAVAALSTPSNTAMNVTRLG